MVDMHHIISDGISMGIMIREFMALYNDEALPATNLQYKDYAAWQHSENQQTRIREQQAFWLKAFADEVSPLQLPTDYPRPINRDFAGDCLRFELSQQEYEQLKALCEKEGVTMFMILISIFSILLSKLGNTEDLVIGTPTAGRPHPDLDNMIGLFVNTLCIRHYPKGEMSFEAYLADTKSKVLAAFENESYPYEQLIDDLQIVQRHQPQSTLRCVYFNYINFGLLAFKDSRSNGINSLLIFK